MASISKIRKIRDWVYQALEDSRAHDISVLDVRKVCDFTDYMVIATGTSNRHVQSTADKVVDILRERHIRPVGIEGEKIGDWVLIDFGDVIVHVMREQTRDFYNIEKLWSDAKRMVTGKKTYVTRAKGSRSKKTAV